MERTRSGHEEEEERGGDAGGGGLGVPHAHTAQVQHGQTIGGDEAVECEDLEHLDRRHQRAPPLSKSSYKVTTMSPARTTPAGWQARMVSYSSFDSKYRHGTCSFLGREVA
jgi:hypothetical protein